MEVSAGGGERGTRRRRKRSHNTARVAVFFLWVILIFTNLSSCSSHSGTSSRKTQFLDKSVSSGGLSPSTSPVDKKGTDKLYGEEERIVHTGPNPLHN